MEREVPFMPSNRRVSCTMVPPSSRTWICRLASCSMACCTKRIEFTFLVSVRVPSGPPGRRIERFTSARIERSEEHTSELQSLMRISYAVFCLKTKKKETHNKRTINSPLNDNHYIITNEQHDYRCTSRNIE